MPVLPRRPLVTEIFTLHAKGTRPLLAVTRRQADQLRAVLHRAFDTRGHGLAVRFTVAAGTLSGIAQDPWRKVNKLVCRRLRHLTVSAGREEWW